MVSCLQTTCSAGQRPLPVAWLMVVILACRSAFAASECDKPAACGRVEERSVLAAGRRPGLPTGGGGGGGGGVSVGGLPGGGASVAERPDAAVQEASGRPSG